MITALIIFIITYILLLVLPKYRAYIALTSALVFIVASIINVQEAWAAIDWNVIMMIAGTMGVVALFIESKMPALLADLIIEKMPNVKWAIIALALFSGLISAFVDNVATVLMVAPVALTISKKLNISPVPSIIAIAISSNLQGAATLVGDTTSIMLGFRAKMTFVDFFIYQGKLGLFFIVQIGALLATLVLLYFFRKETHKIEPSERTVVTDYVPTILLFGTIGLLVLASFFRDSLPALINGYICIGMMVIGIIYSAIRKKSLVVFKEVFKEIDYFTLLLLIGLFIVIGGITAAGVVDEIGLFIKNISGGNVFVIYTILVWISILFSAFVDNIPYVATMLPVVEVIAVSLGIDPTILYFGLICGATLGGNLTPIGASANITALGILRKEGYEVKAQTFMKMSVPFTLAAVTSAYILVWLIWR